MTVPRLPPLPAFLALALATPLGAAPLPPLAQVADSAVRVSRDAVRGAMQAEADRGYNLLATTNSTRFSTSVILAIVREAIAARPQGPSILIHHTDWYGAYREVTGLPPERVPEFVALANEYGQDRIIDYSLADSAVEVVEGFDPELVVRVRVGWPEGTGKEDKYTFVDTLTSPHIRVTNRQRISYWLLDFGDMIVQDRIEGISARPIGGALGALFAIIGDGNAVQNRFAITEDGLVVTYAIVRKGPMKVEPLTVTYPDGTVETEFPAGRDDLQGVANYIMLPLEVEYEDGG
ncbi:MAG: hypothetical protein JSV95_01885 [Gemmatimonadota bacterium]|nr:MAG: hypothetical protein JSV95_01885 [Gemmatimonadota bacterium]